ncbi:MAG: SRPBCC family protein [Parvibaculaceae bacterium]
MKVEQSFVVARALPQVWAAFQDVPAMAQCLPGASLTEDKGGGVYAGRIQTKLGPFSAAFDGEATVTTDPANHTGRVEGKGVDKRGGSRSKLVLTYALVPEGSQTRVNIDADVTLSGPIAQFGRTGFLTETSNVLIREFVSVLERKLAAETPAEAEAVRAEETSALALLVRAIRAWIASWFRRSAPPERPR